MSVSRNTIQRKLVLQAVQTLHTHPTAEEIYAEVSKRHPNISKATVYRNLGMLAKTGEIQRVSHLNAADRFDFQLKPHYHFRCKKCGSVFDVDYPYQNTLLEQVRNPNGFVFEECEITFAGLCNSCQKP